MRSSRTSTGSPAGSGLAAAALAASEGARARGLVELLAEAGIEVRSGIAPELERRQAEIGRRLTGIQRRLLRELAAGERDETLVAALRQRLAAARGERRQLAGEIRRRHPRYADVHYPRPLELSGIRSFLDGDTALLEYALGEERSFLFVVTREAFVAHELAPAAEIAGLVEQFRTAARQPGRRLQGRLNRVSRRLHELLMAPAAGSLEGVEKLLIIPDRELFYLPFEALLAPSGETLHRAVAYAPSATVLSSLSRSASPPAAAGGGSGKRFVGFAQPLDPARGWGPAETPAVVTRGAPEPFQRWSWPPLPGAADEVRAVARLYPENEAVVYVGADAGEETLKGNPVVAQARVLHFAVHAIVDDREPAYSSLLLGSAAGAGEDGLLQVHEIFNLRLDAELVVLSACDTGLGKRLRGEGILGLSRAFFYAGATAMVVSLWPVADAASGELMQSFYRYLTGGMDRAEALRAAKRELRAEGRYGHPFYWAPFILVGPP